MADILGKDETVRRAAQKIIDGDLDSSATSDPSIADPGSDGTKAQSVQGVTGGKAVNVAGAAASGAAASGNPVPAGVVFSAAAGLTAQDAGDVVNAQGDIYGNVRVRLVGAQAVPVDTGTTSMLVNTYSSNSATGAAPLAVLGYNFNGTNTFSSRGDSTGTYVVGNVADNGVDAGNPVAVASQAQSTAPTYTAGDRSVLQSDLSGNLKVTLASGGNLITANTLVDGLASSSRGIYAASFGYVWDGSLFQRARGDTLGTYVTGPTAHDAAATGNPVRIGAKARTANVTAVTNGDAVDLTATTTGSLTVSMNTIPEEWNQDAVSSDSGITTSGETNIKGAAAAGIRRYVTSFQLSNASATATLVKIRDGSGGTVLWKIKLPANMSPTNFMLGSPLKSSAATALVLEVVTAGAEVHMSAQGFNAP